VDASTIERIEIFSWWNGFADPPAHAAKLTITRVGTRYFREWALVRPSEELPTQLMIQFLNALSRPPIPGLDPLLFDLPESVLQDHYRSDWTDDHPRHLVRVVFSADRIVAIQADAQQAFMLPLGVTDLISGEKFETFDPRLSRAIAALLPEGYLEKERLAGRCWLLDLALREYARREKRSLDFQERVNEREGLKGVIARFTRGLWAVFTWLSGIRTNRKASPNEGYTGLHLACADGVKDIARELVQAGADVHARTPEGATPLMLAATWGEIVRLLLRAGADVNAVDQDGHTALVYVILKQSLLCSWLCAEGKLEAMGLMIEAGADVNKRDKLGITPLRHARNVLARVQLEEEICRAFNPDVDMSLGFDWDDRRFAEAVVELILSAGGQE
jgi:hypothetical protein